MKKLLIVMVILVFFVSNIAFAEFITFHKEYTYQAKEADSKLTCRIIAVEQVKRIILEEIGIYLINETRVKNFKLTHDEIVALTAGSVKTEIIDERWDGKTYTLRAKITVDPHEVANSIDALRRDYQKKKELEQAKKKADDLLKEMETLKEANGSATKQQKAIRQKEYDEKVKSLGAVDWFYKGILFMQSKQYSEAVEAFSKTIELQPDFALAYMERSHANFSLKKDQQALQDIDKSIKLAPKDAQAYFFRGNIYAYLGQHKFAIKDLDRVININPRFSPAYTLRGISYTNLRKYTKALKDFDQAIKLEPENAFAYSWRGHAYGLQNNCRKAINDLDRAIQLNPNISAAAYYDRAVCNGILGKLWESINDFDKAIELNDQYYAAYYNRGITYDELKDYSQAILNYNRCIQIKPGNADLYFARGFAYANLYDNHGDLNDKQYAIDDITTAARMGNKKAQKILQAIRNKEIW